MTGVFSKNLCSKGFLFAVAANSEIGSAKLFEAGQLFGAPGFGFQDFGFAATQLSSRALLLGFIFSLQIGLFYTLSPAFQFFSQRSSAALLQFGSWNFRAPKKRWPASKIFWRGRFQNLEIGVCSSRELRCFLLHPRFPPFQFLILLHIEQQTFQTFQTFQPFCETHGGCLSPWEAPPFRAKREWWNEQ